MVGWHHQLDGHGFGWTPGVGDGQGDLACCGSWGCKESDMTEWLNWTGSWEFPGGKFKKQIYKWKKNIKCGSININIHHHAISPTGLRQCLQNPIRSLSLPFGPCHCQVPLWNCSHFYSHLHCKWMWILAPSHGGIGGEAENRLTIQIPPGWSGDRGLKQCLGKLKPCRCNQRQDSR